MTISNELGWFWKEPLVSTLVFWTFRSVCSDRLLEKASFQNHPNSLEIVITWCYRNPFHIIFPPCKVSNPTILILTFTDGCKCNKGFMPPDCFQPCDQGTFGQDCLTPCPCEHGGDCDPITGKCQCLPGYAGKHCQLSKFTHGLLGPSFYLVFFLLSTSWSKIYYFDSLGDHWLTTVVDHLEPASPVKMRKFVSFIH